MKNFPFCPSIIFILMVVFRDFLGNLKAIACTHPQPCFFMKPPAQVHVLANYT